MRVIFECPGVIFCFVFFNGCPIKKNKKQLTLGQAICRLLLLLCNSIKQCLCIFQFMMGTTRLMFNILNPFYLLRIIFYGHPPIGLLLFLIKTGKNNANKKNGAQVLHVYPTALFLQMVNLGVTVFRVIINIAELQFQA